MTQAADAPDNIPLMNFIVQVDHQRGPSDWQDTVFPYMTASALETHDNHVTVVSK